MIMGASAVYYKQDAQLSVEITTNSTIKNTKIEVSIKNNNIKIKQIKLN